jgi:hypothetical protein
VCNLIKLVYIGKQLVICLAAYNQKSNSKHYYKGGVHYTFYGLCKKRAMSTTMIIHLEPNVRTLVIHCVVWNSLMKSTWWLNMDLETKTDYLVHGLCRNYQIAWWNKHTKKRPVHTTWLASTQASTRLWCAMIYLHLETYAILLLKKASCAENNFTPWETKAGEIPRNNSTNRVYRWKFKLKPT